MHQISCFLVIFSLLSLSACGGGNGVSNVKVIDDKEPGDYDDLRAYSQNGPYSDVIVDCVNPDNNTSCTLSELPLIGLRVENPGVEDIMEHLVISHDWMASRFEQALIELPEEILPLFKGLTAVVIDDDIRPAFYTSATGAIYIDPAYLWVEPDEKLSINTKADHRAGNDDPLNFRPLARYMDGPDYFVGFSSLTDEHPRPFDDMLLVLARVLIHELAHVNDFIPPQHYADLDLSQTVLHNTNSLVGQRPSSGLDFEYPLNSSLLYDLAEVMYWGETTTTNLNSVDAVEVAEAFAPEGASDHYAYASQYEDAAMLFENIMMKHLFDLDYQVAFSDAPEDEAYCQFYIVRWGQRNRIGDDLVKERGRYITNSLLPSIDLDSFFEDLGPVEQMTNGEDWCIESRSGDSPNKVRGLQKIPKEDYFRSYY